MESKPYIVIARKYRPQTFQEVMGQDAVSTTLRNAIEMCRIGHAYLFTGPRGVGKTSMARIFAKALNCKEGPTITPCGKCPACAEIEQARSLDVMEIDGASNRGIDEIRALRENVRFSPSSGKFKIYIIDEVHQITTDAFNALLKTLEEPPAYVKFIFATTSAQKVPATILSRCQRFDFRRIPSDLIFSTLKEICKKEKIKIEDDALYVIAQAADGSFRDSQSILDQIASSTQDKITKKDVVFSLGALQEEKLFEIMDAIAARDAKAAILTLHSVLSEGKDPALFLEKFLEHVRNLLFTHISDDLSGLIEASDSYKKELARQKSSFSKEELFYFFSVITHTLQLMRRFEMKRVPLEMALIKLSQRVPMENLSEVLEKLKAGGPAVSSAPQASRPAVSAPAPVRPTPPPAAPAAVIPPPPVHKRRQEEEEVPELEELPSDDVELGAVYREPKNVSVESVWQAVIAKLRTEKISVASYLAEGELLGLSQGFVKVAFPERLNFHRECLEINENKRLIEKNLTEALGQEIRIEFESVKEISGKTAASEENAAPKASPETDNAIKSAMNIFGGRVVGK